MPNSLDCRTLASSRPGQPGRSQKEQLSQEEWPSEDRRYIGGDHRDEQRIGSSPRVCSSPAGSLRVGLPIRDHARDVPDSLLLFLALLPTHPGFWEGRYERPGRVIWTLDGSHDLKVNQVHFGARGEVGAMPTTS